MTDLATLAHAWLSAKPHLRDMTLRQCALLGIVADAETFPSYADLAEGLLASKPVVSRAFKVLIK